MNMYLDLFLTFARVGVMTFGGVRVCVCVLIFNSVVKLYRKAVVDRATLAIFLLVTAGAVFTQLSPVWFVLVAGAVGVALRMLQGRAKK